VPTVAAQPETPPTPVEPVAVCAPDGTGARLAVELAFAELMRLHRGRVPGPTGQQVIGLRLERLLERFVRFERFVDDALGEAWNSAPDRRHDWQTTISAYMQRRYLDRLGSPIGARLEIVSVRHDCDEARLRMVVHSARGRKKSDVELRMVLDLPRPAAPSDPAPPDTDPFGSASWRAFDVSVDGVSLLETWKGRFRRIFADGGVAAIDEHLRNLGTRSSRSGEP
jgi:ABC-type transporter MlaC component